MTSLLFGQVFSGDPVPADEKNVRNTATPVNINKPAAEQEGMPEQGEVETDHDPTLGLGPRQLASEWHEGSPVDTSVRLPAVAGVTASTAMVNGQVSTSGFAAGREAAGQAHRDLSYAIGIEPVSDLKENGAFGEKYFRRNERDIQAGMGMYMTTPPVVSSQTVAASGKIVGREATEASIYDLFLNGG